MCKELRTAQSMSCKSVIENIYAHLAEGDLEPIFDVLAPDAQWIEAENLPYSPGGPIVGHDGVRKLFDNMADWAEFRIDLVRIIAAGTTVLAEGRYVGTTKAGKKLDAVFAHIWDFDGDAIVNVQQYSDTWQWHRVLDPDA
jgi:uncharacterized protein